MNKKANKVKIMKIVLMLRLRLILHSMLTKIKGTILLWAQLLWIGSLGEWLVLSRIKNDAVRAGPFRPQLPLNQPTSKEGKNYSICLSNSWWIVCTTEMDATEAGWIQLTTTSNTSITALRKKVTTPTLPAMEIVMSLREPSKLEAMLVLLGEVAVS